MDAIRKLPPTNGNRKILIDLIVIRVAKNGSLKSSHPCSKCLLHLHNLCLKTNYKLKYIYYSDENGQINKVKFTKLLLSEEYISSRFRK